MIAVKQLCISASLSLASLESTSCYGWAAAAGLATCLVDFTSLLLRAIFFRGAEGAVLGIGFATTVTNSVSRPTAELPTISDLARVADILDFNLTLTWDCTRQVLAWKIRLTTVIEEQGVPSVSLREPRDSAIVPDAE